MNVIAFFPCNKLEEDENTDINIYGFLSGGGIAESFPTSLNCVIVVVFQHVSMQNHLIEVVLLAPDGMEVDSRPISFVPKQHSGISCEKSACTMRVEYPGEYMLLLNIDHITCAKYPLLFFK